MRLTKVLQNSLMTLTKPGLVFRRITGREDISYLQIAVTFLIYAVTGVLFHNLFLHKQIPTSYEIIKTIVYFPVGWIGTVLIIHLIGTFLFHKVVNIRKVEMATFYMSFFFPLMPFIDFIPHVVLGLPVGSSIFGCVHFSQLIVIIIFFRQFYAIFRDIYRINNNLWLIYIISILPFLFGKIVLVNLPLFLIPLKVLLNEYSNEFDIFIGIVLLLTFLCAFLFTKKKN